MRRPQRVECVTSAGSWAVTGDVTEAGGTAAGARIAFGEGESHFCLRSLHTLRQAAHADGRAPNASHGIRTQRNRQSFQKKTGKGSV